MRNLKREARHTTDRERARDIALNTLAEEFADAMRAGDLKHMKACGLHTPRMSDIWGRYMLIAVEYGDME